MNPLLTEIKARPREKILVGRFLFMKMMLPDVIGHENQSQYYQHHRCLCLDLSVIVIVIVNSKLLKRHSKAKRRAPAYSRADVLPRRTDFHTTPALRAQPEIISGCLDLRAFQ